MTVLLGSNELKTPLLGATTLKQIRAGDKKVFPKGYTPNANTLFYVTNNWDISDHSQYNHTMQWKGTANFETLSSWIKVASLWWGNFPFSNQFTEANNKTSFTLHIRVKLKSWNPSEIIIGWWCWRNPSWTDTWDRWGARFQSDTAWSRTYILYGPNSTSWVNTESAWSLYTSLSTSAFALLTATISWGTTKIYKNWSLVGSLSSSSIRWWSSTWPRFYYWGIVYPNGDTWVAWMYGYFGEVILEDKVETQAEIQEYYNLTKSLYWIS